MFYKCLHFTPLTGPKQYMYLHTWLHMQLLLLKLIVKFPLTSTEAGFFLKAKIMSEAQLFLMPSACLTSTVLCYF